MNKLLSYCGLVDARISASEKDLPSQFNSILIQFELSLCLVCRQTYYVKTTYSTCSAEEVTAIRNSFENE